jgi:hypothetical protein
MWVWWIMTGEGNCAASVPGILCSMQSVRAQMQNVKTNQAPSLPLSEPHIW